MFATDLGGIWIYSTQTPHVNTGEVYLVSVRQPKGHLTGILYGFTDQGVTTGKQQRFLDTRRVVSDYVNHQLDIPGVTDVSGNISHTKREKQNISPRLP